jgi:hypothetical protein
VVWRVQGWNFGFWIKNWKIALNNFSRRFLIGKWRHKGLEQGFPVGKGRSGELEAGLCPKNGGNIFLRAIFQLENRA